MHCLLILLTHFFLYALINSRKCNIYQISYFCNNYPLKSFRVLAFGIDRNFNFEGRLIQEKELFEKNPPENCELITTSGNLKIWLVKITGLKGTVYENEVYTLKIIFPNEYPLKPPIMYFLQPAPKHEHVYSNGDICLSALGSDYAPNASVSSLVLSLISMLSSAKEKRLPLDDQLHAQMPPGEADSSYVYHDDKC